MVGDEKSKLKALTNISSIDITLEFDEILENILKITCETMNAHSGTMMLVDEGTDELRMVASYGLGPDYIEKVYAAAEKAGVHLTSSPSGTVLKTGKYYLVPNIFEEPKDRPWYDLSRELGFSAQIFTPMKRGTKVIGLLNVYMAEPHQFTDEEINFVTIAASQAASVVQNARICNRLKNNVQELNQYKKHLEEKVKDAYKDLCDSENYLKTIIESSFDGIIVVDEHGRFEFGNDAFIKILGWPRDELIGQHFIKVIPKDMEEFILKRWQEIQNGVEEPYETKIITKNGELKYLYVSHVRTKIKGKRKYVVIIKDITEHKKLELEIRESEARYRELFENAQEAIYTSDAMGHFLTINNSGLKIFGCTKKEIIGSHFSSWISPDCLEVALENFNKLLSGEPVEQPIIWEIVRKNGEHRWIELKVRVIKDGDRITGLHGMFNDITEKRDLEVRLRYYHEKLRMSFEKLKIAEARYRDLFENANDIIYIIDAQGNFQSINNAGLKIFGSTEDDVIGTHISRWLTPESTKIVHETLNKLTSGEPTKLPIVVEAIRKNGEHLWLEMNGRIIKDVDGIKGFHGIARDITEKRKMELKLAEYHEQLEKSYEELKEADRIKTEFVSNITHELLTPLTSIKGFTELILHEKIGMITSEQKKSLKIILRNSDRLIRLIKDLLAAANLENNKLELQFGLVSMNDILLKTIQDMQPLAEEKQISIIQNIQPLPKIYGDEERLTQVITNLLVNAIKFTPQKGTVTITTGVDQDGINISITDTGIGIPADKLPHIFDRFYQVNSTASRKYGGVGLGLSICKSIVEKHSGTICAQSDGNGTTFHIVLPKIDKNLT